MLLAGALLVGFGPVAWGILRQLSGRAIVSLIFGLIGFSGLTFMVWTMGSLLYSIIFGNPSNYVAPEFAHKNSDEALRVFTTLTPRDFERPFTDSTDIVAHAQLQAEFGKWIAITGPIYNISQSPTADGIHVLLGRVT